MPQYIDLNLDVENEAWGMLQEDAKRFINETLKYRYTIIKGFCWLNIELYTPSSVLLCKKGIPWNDEVYSWVYNTVTEVYELYISPYPHFTGRHKNRFLGPILSHLHFFEFVDDLCRMDNDRLEDAAERFRNQHSHN